MPGWGIQVISLYHSVFTPSTFSWPHPLVQSLLNAVPLLVIITIMLLLSFPFVLQSFMLNSPLYRALFKHMHIYYGASCHIKGRNAEACCNYPRPHIVIVRFLLCTFFILFRLVEICAFTFTLCCEMSSPLCALCAAAPLRSTWQNLECIALFSLILITMDRSILFFTSS